MTQLYGDYEVESFLGKGSIGKVFLARHRRFGRRVALKTVHLEQKFEDDEDREEFYKRLQREAELCGSMQHPNIVTLYDVGYEGEVVSYLATEYVEGESLLARLRRTRPLPLDEALSLAADLFRGLAYAHSKGIIHRDIKPANILLTADGRAKIADFGVARPLHSSLTVNRSLVGTPNYMSPEQVKTTPVSTRSDLFSAGIVLYEMLTGIKPFGAPELSGILYNVVNLNPPLVTETNTSVPPAIAQIVARLLQKNPDDRYAMVDDALADLESVRSARAALDTVTIDSGEMTTALPTVIEEVDRPAVLHRAVPAWMFWTITLGLAVALLASVALLQRSAKRQRPTGVMTAEQRLEQEEKLRDLATARELAKSSRYAEAIVLYDAYLERWPHSVVAREEREEAQRRLDALTLKPEVTEAPKPSRRPTSAAASKQDTKKEEKPSRWQRFKRWLAEDPSKPKSN